MNKKPDIKIFVVCHKPSFVPENELLYPIQVGSALTKKRIENMLHDDEGDNISDRNKSFCEMTAHYWAWKNVDADYYGFFHYRRYFSFNLENDNADIYGNIEYQKLNDDVIADMQLNAENMKNIIQKNDMVIVKARKLLPPIGMKKVNVYSDYGIAPFQHREDLDITIKVLYEKYPEYRESAEKYLESDMAHECNMFIMSKALYQQYCSWIFDILFEVERRVDTTYYSVEEYRIYGYLAERLTGIFYKYIQSLGKYKTLELNKTLFRETDPILKIKKIDEEAVPIVLSANDAFAPCMDIMVRSIVINASNNREYDIVILHSNINERNQELIKDSVRCHENIHIRFARVSSYFDIDKLFVNQHLSVETYFRLIIPKIMPDYDKILYLDCDMVVDYDVAELYDLDIGDAVIGAAKDIDVLGQVNLKKNDWQKYAVDTLGLDSPYDYFQAGVLILNLKEIRKMTTSEKMINLAMSNEFRCHDQDVLNIVCKNKVFYLPQEWNTLMCWTEEERTRMDIIKMAPRDLYQEYMTARKKPKIVHFAGYQKPWQKGDCDFSEYFWKYAIMSPYYPLLQRHIYFFQHEIDNDKYYNPLKPPKHRKLVDFTSIFLPYGSKRRNFIKKVYYKFKK